MQRRVIVLAAVILMISGCSEKFGYRIEQSLFGSSTPAGMEIVDGKLVGYNFRLLPEYQVSHEFWWGYDAEQCSYPAKTINDVWVSSTRRFYRNYQERSGWLDLYSVDERIYYRCADRYCRFEPVRPDNLTCRFRPDGGEVGLTLSGRDGKSMGEQIEYIKSIWCQLNEKHEVRIIEENRGGNTWTVLIEIAEGGTYASKVMFLPIGNSGLYFELYIARVDFRSESERIREFERVVDSFKIVRLTIEERAEALKEINDVLKPWVMVEKAERERKLLEFQDRDREEQMRKLAERERMREHEEECKGIILFKPKCWGE